MNWDVIDWSAIGRQSLKRKALGGGSQVRRPSLRRLRKAATCKASGEGLERSGRPHADGTDKCRDGELFPEVWESSPRAATGGKTVRQGSLLSMR
jgi:hypothetical protein